MCRAAEPSLTVPRRPAGRVRATSGYRSIARGVLQAIEDFGGPRSESLASLPKVRPVPRLAVFGTQQPFMGSAWAYPIPDFRSACEWIDLEIGLDRPSGPPGKRYEPRLSSAAKT